MAIFRGYVRSQLKTIPNNSAEAGGMNPSNWWFVIAFGTFQGFKIVLSIYWKLFRQLSGFEGPIWNPAIFWFHIKGIYIYVYLCIYVYIYVCIYIYPWPWESYVSNYGIMSIFLGRNTRGMNHLQWSKKGMIFSIPCGGMHKEPQTGDGLWLVWFWDGRIGCGGLGVRVPQACWFTTLWMENPHWSQILNHLRFLRCSIKDG